MKINKKLMVLTMLCVSMFQMGMVGLAPVISSLTTAFPGTSALTAQMATTFLNLILVLFALCSGPISRTIGRRMMCAVGMGLFTLAGLCGTFLTVGIWAVFLWSAFLGAGTGLFVPAVSSMMIDYLEDEERTRIAGIQTAFVNLGGMALSFFAGILATSRWSNAYLVYLLSAPVLVMSLKFIPKEQAAANKAAVKKSSRIPKAVWLATLQTFLFAVLYFAFSTNISMLLTEKNILSSSMSGIATAVFMLGGCLFGFTFTWMLKRFGRFTAAMAFLVLTISYGIIFLFDGMAPLLLAAFIGGGSLSIIFPFFLVTIADQVDPSISVISTSLILSVGPNFGSFVSPMILTNLSGVLFGDSVVHRFLLAACFAALMMAILLASNLRKGKS